MSMRTWWIRPSAHYNGEFISESFAFDPQIYDGEQVQVIEMNAILPLIEALKKCCAPDPDGLGGFVGDEFTEAAVLEGRAALAGLPVELREMVKGKK